MSNALRPHLLQHARLPCPLPTSEACSNSCPLSWWCHPTILSSVYWRDSFMHIHVSILPQTPLPSRLPQSFMCYCAPCWVFILNKIVCTCPSQTPCLSLFPLFFLPLPLPSPNIPCCLTHVGLSSNATASQKCPLIISSQCLWYFIYPYIIYITIHCHSFPFFSPMLENEKK